MLEEMGAFFDARLQGYEEHQLTCIAGAEEFYPFTAQLLPDHPGVTVLDLGCGTGLELNFYFSRAPHARVTGIDLAPGMLQALQQKFPERSLTLHQASYFTFPLGQDVYDAAVSVESLHHFTREQKLPLYRKLFYALKPGGFFLLTDYFADSDNQEQFFQQELVRLKQAQGLPDTAFYHYDTPLTLAHELQCLLDAGFSSAQVMGSWGATHTIKAIKER